VNNSVENNGANRGADRLLDLIDRVVRPLALWMGGALVIALALLTVVAVCFRYILNSPIFGAADIAQLLLLGAVTVSVAYSGRTGGQVAVELLGSAVSEKSLRWTDLIVNALGAAMMTILAWQLYQNGFDAADYGEASNSLLIPFGPFYQILAVGMALYAVVLLLEVIALLRGKIVTRESESLEGTE